jgi:hypothetical protein
MSDPGRPGVTEPIEGYDDRIDLAIDELDNSNTPNIAEVARKYNVNRSTLSHR